MDWHNRKYYCASFSPETSSMRTAMLKLLGNVKVYSYRKVQKQLDELEDRGHYQFLISAPIDRSEAVEYELRKAERRDDWCLWKELKKNGI